MSTTKKMLNSLLDDAGHEVLFSGAVVIDAATGTSFSAHAGNANIHMKQADIAALISTASNLLKDNGDGNTLPQDADSLKKISDTLGALKNVVNTFMTGAPDAGTIDRLSELLAAITANKDTIDALLTDKVDKTSIYNGLDSTDATKLLSAAQGKVLKDLIDASKSLLDGMTVDGNGNLNFNGKILDGSTGIAFVGKADDIPVYSGKLRMVIADYTPPVV